MMNNTTIEEGTTVTVVPKTLDFAKVDALRAHMLLTVDSMVQILGVSRVSYYNWLKGGKMRKPMQDKIRRATRALLTVVSNHNWPNEVTFVAKQPQRLQMLKELLETLDKEPA